MNLKNTVEKLIKGYKFILVVFIIFLLCYCLYVISPSIGISFSTFVIIYFSRVVKKNHEKIKKGDVIVITGCDSGLGYSLALHSQNNLNVQVLAGVHSSTSPGAQELTKHGVEIFETELTSLESIESFAKSIRDYLTTGEYRLRGFINNAGIMIFGEFEWQTDDQIWNQLHVNLLGTVRLTRAMIPVLREHKSRLVIVTSHCAIEPLPGVAIYGATKAALSAWSTSLRIELKKSGINVINFVPGSFVGDSNILLRQRQHFQEMDMAMKEEAKNFYDGYFQRYVAYLSAISQNNSLNIINQPELYKVFNLILLEKHPKSFYKCEPWRYWLYFALFKISPTVLRDFFVEQFIQMPPWKIREKWIS